MTHDSASPADRVAIAGLLFRFAASFDRKDWDAMRECLGASIHCDYSSLRGTPPGDLSRDDYVAQRSAALAALETRHDLTNLLVTVEDDSATVRCDFVIRRFRASPGASPGGDFFDSCGRYRFRLIRRDEAWRIVGITQVVRRNRGNPEIHGGTPAASKASS